MLINSFGDRLLRDIVPNCIYLRGTGKIVSVVIFFFTNKVVARTSHACRINARSNKGYLFSSSLSLLRFASDFLPTGLDAVVSWLLIMDTGKGKTPTATLLSTAPGQSYKPAEASTSPPSTPGSCLQPLRGSEILKLQLQEQQLVSNPLVADKIFQGQTLAPGSRDSASPKGLSQFIQLNYPQ